MLLIKKKNIGLRRTLDFVDEKYKQWCSCRYRVLKEYQWLKTFHALIHENCHYLPTNFNYLRYTSYILTIYNTFLVHILVSSILTCVSVGMSTYGYAIHIRIYYSISKSHYMRIIRACSIFDIVGNYLIMITFIFLKERHAKSLLALQKSFEQDDLIHFCTCLFIA